jgi:hypothetical protein
MIAYRRIVITDSTRSARLLFRSHPEIDSEDTMSSDSGSATKKQAVLDRIAKERSTWDALVAEVDPAWAVEPNAMEEWSFKDVVAHLAGWRQLFVDELVAAVQGTPVPPQIWPFAFDWSEEGKPEGDANVRAINVWLTEQSRDRTYDQVLAHTSLQWTMMQAAIDLMPDELVERSDVIASLGGHSLAEALLGPNAFSHFHVEHEPEIRAWLARQRAGGLS